MPFEKGNKLGVNKKLFAQALRRAVVQSDGKALRDIAEKQIEKAREGDLQAAVFIRDTLDGKPVQQIEMEAEINDKRSKDMSIGELQRAIADEIARTGEASTGKGEPAQVH